MVSVTSLNFQKANHTQELDRVWREEEVTHLETGCLGISRIIRVILFVYRILTLESPSGKPFPTEKLKIDKIYQVPLETQIDILISVPPQEKKKSQKELVGSTRLL